MNNYEKIKIRDLIEKEIDIDIYDTYDETISIAFCGPILLTKEGEKEFSDILDFELEYGNEFFSYLLHFQYDFWLLYESNILV